MPETSTVRESSSVKKLDVWSFTSPRAIREFERKGTVESVRRDIEREVLEGGDWSEQDREYLEQVSQLLRKGVVEEKGSYWYCSPFPATYRALKDGELLGRRFQKGQDIVYQPAKNVNSEERLVVGKFSTTTETQLHSEHSTMKGKMD